MTLALPSGPRNAITDEQSGIRYYHWQGRKYPSVTSLRRLAGLPFGLANWQVNQALKAAVANSSVLDMMVGSEGIEATTKWLRKQAMYERDSAANRGTAVHEAASQQVGVTEVDAEIAGPLAQYYDFLDATKAEVLLSEREVWNLKLGYGGQLDAVWRLQMPGWRKPRIIVGDLKTGKNIYAEHALQLMFYALAEFVGEDDVIDNEATALLHSAQGLAVLHLTDTTWELYEIEATPYLLRVAESLVDFAYFMHENPTPANLVTRMYTP